MKWTKKAPKKPGFYLTALKTRNMAWVYLIEVTDFDTKRDFDYDHDRRWFGPIPNINEGENFKET